MVSLYIKGGPPTIDQSCWFPVFKLGVKTHTGPGVTTPAAQPYDADTPRWGAGVGLGICGALFIFDDEDDTIDPMEGISLSYFVP